MLLIGYRFRVPFTVAHRGVPVKVTISISEVWLATPFLAAFASPVFPPCNLLLLGVQRMSSKLRLECGSKQLPWPQLTSALTAMLLAHNGPLLLANFQFLIKLFYFTALFLTTKSQSETSFSSTPATRQLPRNFSDNFMCVM